MEVKIGTTPSSWGVWFANDPKQLPWQRFLDEVVEAGYEWIELGPLGYLPTDPPRLQKELDQRGLSVTGAFAMRSLEEPSTWPELEKQVRSAGELAAALGAKFFTLLDATFTDLYTGERTGPVRLDESAWRRLIDTTHKMADLVAADFGLRLLFEAHTDTHVQYRDQIEALLEQTDPDRVSFCLDTGHHVLRGGDPVSFMRRHHDRIPYLHFKSVDPDVYEKVEAEKIPFATAVGMGIFCEPSQGTVDFPALLDVLREIDWEGWAIVEQGMYPAPFDKPLPIAKSSRDYLREIGFG